MKKNLLLMFVAGLMIFFAACNSDDDTPQMAPTISVTPTTETATPGATVNFTVTTASASSTVASVTANDGTTTEDVTGGTYAYTVAATAAANSSITITFTVTDAAGMTNTAQATITVQQGTIDITDADLVAGGTYNWTNNNVYMLDGLVYLEAGGTLNIQEGTVIRFKAQPSNTDPTSSLIITNGAQIFAEGTATEPIIFTAELDDLAGGVLQPSDNRQWAGLILLGSAPAEKGGATSGLQIEGIESTETRGSYGGTNPNDNSGTLRYVSIRYTGFALNGQSGDEIQGLTLGGVGAGTTLDYIDIFSSADDGIEIFGGTVNVTHISVAFSTDDDFDFDLGWRGYGQFLFGLMLDGTNPEAYDHSGEWDGASPDDATLFSAPNLYNATFIGPGQNATGRQRALLLRESFAGKLGNSVLEDFPGAGIEVQDVDGNTTTDSYAVITQPREGFQLEVLNNTWAQFGGFDGTVASMVSGSGQTADVVAELTDNANTVLTTAYVGGISRATDGGLDPRPAADDANVANVPAGLQQANYRGAFQAGQPTWLAGWSTLSKLGYLVD